MRSLVALAVAGVVCGPAPFTAAASAETYVCWLGAGADGPGARSPVIRCRIAGSRIKDFTPDRPPPIVLLPAVGTDASGGCWYRRSWWSGWSLVTRYPDGSARLRFDPDRVPGGPILADAVLPGCHTEPSDAPPDIEFAWRLVTSMRLGPASVVTVPPRPISGLITYLTVNLTSKRRGSLVSPVTGHRIDVRAAAAEVVVDWGDGSERSRHDASDPALAAPRPDAALTHVYERSGAVDVGVELTWNVHWRVDLGRWISLPIEPSARTSPLVIDQIVGRLVGSPPRR